MKTTDTPRRNLAVRMAWVRFKQVFAVGFVVVTTTILIQNIAYPSAFQEWKRTFRALIGSGIFLMGFTVARILFEQYREQIRAMAAPDAVPAPDTDTETIPEQDTPAPDTPAPEQETPTSGEQPPA